MTAAASVPRAARVTDPHQLHALAALWSVHRAWTELRHARRAAASAAAEDDDRGTLQAWRPGVGRRGAPAGDQLAGAALGSATTATAGHYQQLAERVRLDIAQTVWLAASELGHTPAGATMVEQLAGSIPQLGVRTCRDITSWLTGTDRAIRRALDLPPDLRRLPGNPACPVCTVRMLRVQASADDTAQWTVVCTVPCRCSGEGCPCGMPVRVRGVAHIWDSQSDLVTAALTRT